MSTPPCFSCQEVLSCEDSALSTTGSIVGILTFATAIIIGLQVWYNSIRNAERNIIDLASLLASRLNTLKALVHKVDVASQSGRLQPGPASDHLHQAFDRLRDPLGEGEYLFLELEGGAKDDGKRPYLARAKFVIREKDIRESVGKLEKAIDDLKVVAQEVMDEEEQPAREEERAFRSYVQDMMGRMMYEIVELRTSIAKEPREEKGDEIAQAEN